MEILRDKKTWVRLVYLRHGWNELRKAFSYKSAAVRVFSHVNNSVVKYHHCNIMDHFNFAETVLLQRANRVAEPELHCVKWCSRGSIV
jgi:hypothetical protein